MEVSSEGKADSEALGRLVAGCQEVSKGGIIWFSGYQSVASYQQHQHLGTC